MKHRKNTDTQNAREKRNILLERAASGGIPLTEGIREMRAISGLSQEQFAQHRSISPRILKQLEKGQGNPTIATLNQIGEFYGLEVAFVRKRHAVVPTGSVHAWPGSTGAVQWNPVQQDSLFRQFKEPSSIPAGGAVHYFNSPSPGTVDLWVQARIAEDLKKADDLVREMRRLEQLAAQTHQLEQDLRRDLRRLSEFKKEVEILERFKNELHELDEFRDFLRKHHLPKENG